jgi:hypothetical protein
VRSRVIASQCCTKFFRKRVKKLNLKKGCRFRNFRKMSTSRLGGVGPGSTSWTVGAWARSQKSPTLQFFLMVRAMCIAIAHRQHRTSIIQARGQAMCVHALLHRNAAPNFFEKGLKIKFEKGVSISKFSKNGYLPPSQRAGGAKTFSRPLPRTSSRINFFSYLRRGP